MSRRFVHPSRLSAQTWALSRGLVCLKRGFDHLSRILVYPTRGLVCMSRSLVLPCMGFVYLSRGLGFLSRGLGFLSRGLVYPKMGLVCLSRCYCDNCHLRFLFWTFRISENQGNVSLRVSSNIS